MIAILSNFDVGRGLLALVISVALFSAVQRDQNPPETGSFDVALDLVNTPPGLLVLGDEPLKSAQVRLSAPREVWLSLRSSAVRAVVDLSKGTTGAEHPYPVSVEVPDRRIRVVEVVPPQVSVRLDENVERSVPVRLTRSGALPFGYEAGAVQVEPATVAVGGPASMVRRVEGANVEVKLDGVTVNVDARYRATPVDAQGQPMGAERASFRISPSDVRIRIAVAQELSYKTVGIQAAVSGSVQIGYVIEGIRAEPSAVTIVGSPQALAAANFVQTERINVTDASATFTRRVSIVAPEGVSLVQAAVALVTVRVAPLDLTQAITTVPVPEGLTPGLQVLSAIPSVQVLLQGAPSAARPLQPSDLHAAVSLAGLGPGSHQVEVQVTAPSGMVVQSINPRIISVTLESAAGPGTTASPQSAIPNPQSPIPSTLGSASPQFAIRNPQSAIP